MMCFICVVTANLHHIYFRVIIKWIVNGIHYDSYNGIADDEKLYGPCGDDVLEEGSLADISCKTHFLFFVLCSC